MGEGKGTCFWPFIQALLNARETVGSAGDYWKIFAEPLAPPK